jgi:FixJ family two-component response regulator
LLGSFGFSVARYASAEEYLASRNGGDFALLIVDVYMAEMTGLALLERLAADGASPSAIILTAHDTRRLRERARRLGAPVLQKPVEDAELLAAIGRAIGPRLTSHVE